MSMRPRNDHVWGRHRVISASPIILTPYQKAEKYILEVTAIGEGVHDISIGDTVIVPEHGGVKVQIQNDETGEIEEHLIIREDAVLAVWEGT